MSYGGLKSFVHLPQHKGFGFRVANSWLESAIAMHGIWKKAKWCVHVFLRSHMQTAAEIWGRSANRTLSRSDDTKKAKSTRGTSSPDAMISALACSTNPTTITSELPAINKMIRKTQDRTLEHQPARQPYRLD